MVSFALVIISGLSCPRIFPLVKTFCGTTEVVVTMARLGEKM